MLNKNCEIKQNICSLLQAAQIIDVHEFAETTKLEHTQQGLWGWEAMRERKQDFQNTHCKAFLLI